MKKLTTIALLFSTVIAHAQITERISKKVTLSVNTNIETYFIAEKLAVEHIGNYVFSNKNTQFSHQPIVYFAQKEFSPWTNSPVILRIANILQQLRDIFHDNAQTLASGLSGCKALNIDLSTVQTNIVIFHVAGTANHVGSIVRQCAERGILVSAFGGTKLRATTHLDVNREDCSRAADIISQVASD